MRASAVGLLIVLVGCNLYIVWRGQRGVATAAELSPAVVMILGSTVLRDGSLSTILRDRLDTAIDLHRQGLATKLLITGDPRPRNHNEVAAMKAYLLEQGILEGAIEIDAAGYDTYSSLYRARRVFGHERLTIVTQRFHLARALYLAEAMGITARGVVADRRDYHALGVREWLSRCKAIVDVVRGRRPEVLE